MKLVITGADAADIKRFVRSYRVTAQPGWHEVQVLRERHGGCRYGCKLYVRRRGCVDEYRLMHSASYGCPLGHHTAARHVPVKVAS